MKGLNDLSIFCFDVHRLNLVTNLNSYFYIFWILYNYMLEYSEDILKYKCIYLRNSSTNVSLKICSCPPRKKMFMVSIFVSSPAKPLLVHFIFIKNYSIFLLLISNNMVLIKCLHGRSNILKTVLSIFSDCRHNDFMSMWNLVLQMR